MFSYTCQAASAMYPQAQHPLFIWNVLHRAGASQYHGHAQVLLSEVCVWGGLGVWSGFAVRGVSVQGSLGG